MNSHDPIFTEPRECHDCYKCVRNCPVKAIKVVEGRASVLPELCILCGRCVEICPSGAKKVRDDLGRVRQLLASGARVVASLAPSWVGEFPGLSREQMVAALRRVGFHAVSETALGAQLVSASVAEDLTQGPPRPILSSACPAVVSWLQKYQSERACHLTPLLSPVLAHARYLKAHPDFAPAEQLKIVFIGPCIAKKMEADQHPELLERALTFRELRKLLQAERVVPSEEKPSGEDRFVPEQAEEGALYPIAGGMVAGIRANCAIAHPALMEFSGLRSIESALDGLEELPLEESLFVELLACTGGCVNGPQGSSRSGTARKRRAVLSAAPAPSVAVPRPRSALDLAESCRAQPLEKSIYRDAELREALKQVGKFSESDELNCSGCGYDSCRDFARALLAGRAEQAMCVAHMRKLALKKANALIRKMPSAVVIADQSLCIIETNQVFARLFGRPELADANDQAAGEVSSLNRVVPFPNLFNSVLKTGKDILDRDLRYREAILHGSIFTIEPGAIVGGIFQDITRPSVQKEQVVKKAQEVIRKNLETVQKIAYLLGENASESEIILDSIIESFAAAELPEGEKVQDPHDWKRLYRS